MRTAAAERLTGHRRFVYMFVKYNVQKRGELLNGDHHECVCLCVYEWL